MFEMTINIHCPELALLAQAATALAGAVSGQTKPAIARAAAVPAPDIGPATAPVQAAQAFAAPVAAPIAAPQAPLSGSPSVPGPVVQQPSAPAATPAVAPVAPPMAAPVAPAPAAAPTSAPTYTLSQIMAAGANLVQAGKAAELQALMQQVGIARLDQLKPELFGNVAAALRGMGAQI